VNHQLAIALALAGLLALVTLPALGQSRILAQHSQALCQLPRPADSEVAMTLLLDSASAWQRHVGTGGGAPLFGRSIRWPQEQVLLHVLPEQSTMGIRVSAVKVRAGPVLALRVTRPEPGTMAQMAISRPCVWVLVKRSAARSWRVQVQDSAAGAVQNRVPERLAAQATGNPGEQRHLATNLAGRGGVARAFTLVRAIAV
jgi:hypothetical protein